MTKEQYEVILGLFADKIKEQENTINLQKWQIERLDKELQAAEALLPKKETQAEGGQ